MRDVSEWQLVVESHDIVGEGPTWEPTSQSLYWVDIVGKTVRRVWPASGAVWSRQLDQMVGAVLPRTSGGLALCLQDGIWVTDSDDGPARLLAPIEAADESTRLNDAKTDRAGRLFAGTMAIDARPGAGALYRIDADGTVSRIASSVTISNGIDWSVDDTHMYYIDSALPRVDAFDFDVSTGQASARRTLFDLDPDYGIPDGMTVDADDHLWIAFYGGWAVRRFTPRGRLVRTVKLPVSNITSCAFGGPELGDLYVTSARAGLTEAELAEQPLAGSVFVIRAGASGLRVSRYAG